MPLLHALYEGMLVALKLQVCFGVDEPVLNEDLEFYELAIQGLFAALSQCQLMELHLHLTSANIRTGILVVDEFLPRVLRKNKSL